MRCVEAGRQPSSPGCEIPGLMNVSLALLAGAGSRREGGREGVPVALPVFPTCTPVLGSSVLGVSPLLWPEDSLEGFKVASCPEQGPSGGLTSTNSSRGYEKWAGL